MLYFFHFDVESEQHNMLQALWSFYFDGFLSSGSRARFADAPGAAAACSRSRRRPRRRAPGDTPGSGPPGDQGSTAIFVLMEIRYGILVEIGVVYVLFYRTPI